MPLYQINYVTHFISPLDSRRFGFNIAKVNEADNFKKEGFLALLAEKEVKLIISRVDSERIDEINFLEDIGFRVKDMQVTYSFDLERHAFNPPAINPTVLVRDAKEDDIPGLQLIAEQSFDNYGHYFADARLDKTRCREIYSDWIRRSILDRQIADKVFVAEYNRQAAGFLSFKIHESNHSRYAAGVQGAVTESFRGKHIFSALTAAGLHWGAETGIKREEHNVHTTNYPVNRVFSKLGFTPVRAFTTLHYWLSI